MNKKEKKKEINEIIEVVLLGIPKEIAASKFYKSAAQKTTSTKAKNLFNRLSEQERGHEAVLRKILNELQEELAEIS